MSTTPHRLTGLRPTYPGAADAPVPALVPPLCRVCREGVGHPAPVWTQTFFLCDFCRLLPEATLEYLLVPALRREKFVVSPFGERGASAP